MKRVALVLTVLLAPPAAAWAAERSLPVFTDITKQSGIDFTRCFGDMKLSNIVEGTGGGVLLFDYDNDGWLDIYFVNGRWHEDISDNTGRRLRGKLTNKLYHNNHDGTFTDVTEKAGLAGKHFAFSASAADYDNDGNIDLYICGYGGNELYHNNGDGTFTDVTEKSGLANGHWSLHSAWFDYNGDGLLDVYVVTYLEYDKGAFRDFFGAANYPGPLSYKGQPDALYRNNGDGTFTDVTKEAGLWRPNGRGMGVTLCDFNNTGRLDLFVTNDAMPNDFFRNLGNGKYKEEALERLVAFGESGQGVSNMGPTFGDVDRDGHMDLYIPNLDYGTLLMNRGEVFDDCTKQTGLAVVCGQYAGWGGFLFDYDNDGWLDLFIANGNAHNEYAQDPVLMRNDGKGKFIDVARQSGDYFQHKYVSRGAAFGDLDNDGDLDIVVMALNGPATVLRNDGGNKQHWLKVVPRCMGGKRDAIGARVTVTANSMTMIDDMMPTRSYLSQCDPRLHFGLGKAARAERVEVRWPDGTKTELKDVKADQILKIVQPAK